MLKWAGGKSQLLPTLLPLIPSNYGRYIEPFFGGGALFFALTPSRAVIADSNAELVSFYASLRDSAPEVIELARRWPTDEQTFYKVRALNLSDLSSVQRAARLHYLNRTCFNGLYRVNRRGEFNVPYGAHKNPHIGHQPTLLAASRALRNATILCADYLTVLQSHAAAGDFVFLDPPYVPVSQFSDFKRYTKQPFSIADHERLAEEVNRLKRLGCYVILTNSNVPLTRRLYGAFPLKVVPTKRNINSNGQKRTGEDLIVRVEPESIPRGLPAGKCTTGTPKQLTLSADGWANSLSAQVGLYPPTRFMGSKERLLANIWDIASKLKTKRVLDLFAGSGAVSYMFKAQGSSVISNDYMACSWTLVRALVENSTKTISPKTVTFLTSGQPEDDFVQRTFKGLYFSDEDNQFIDLVRSHIWQLDDYMEKTIARAALIRACMKKRARGIFTYVGPRYDDGRKDMKISLREHFENAIVAINSAIFDNDRRCEATNLDALSVAAEADLVYIDPPYYSKLSDNDYVRRYHFVEGLARDWLGVEMQPRTKTKKFRTYGSPFATYDGAVAAFETLFRRFADSALIVSYSSNSLPDKETMVSLLRRIKRDVEAIPVSHRYSFGNQGHKTGNVNNQVSEYLFVAT